jgi:hypothetical protein
MSYPPTTLPADSHLFRVRAFDFNEDGKLKSATFAYFCLSVQELYHILCWKWMRLGCPRPFTFTIDEYVVKASVEVALLSNCEKNDRPWTFEDLEQMLQSVDPSYRPSIKHQPGALPIGENLNAARALASQGNVQGWLDHKSGNGMVSEVMLVKPCDKLFHVSSSMMDFGDYIEKYPAVDDHTT